MSEEALLADLKRMEREAEEKRDPMKRAIAQSLAHTDGRKNIYFTDHGVDSFLRELRQRGFDVTPNANSPATSTPKP